MLLQVTHETRYAYTPSVETAQHLAHLRPLVTASQALLEHRLEITPEPAQRSESTDAYGNARAFFALESTHESLSVVAHSLVRTPPPVLDAAASRELPWEQVRERFRYRKGAAHDPAAEFVFPSRYVPRHEDFAAYARASFAPGRPLFEAAQDLSQRIFNEFIYDGDSTEISTPAVQALAQRRGVCQDFAHIMIALVRQLGIPCRYVSGYLFQQGSGDVRSTEGATHAWVEALLPDLGWIGFDPTNNILAGAGHIRVAIGRDYTDVPPTRGVFKGLSAVRSELAVAVAVGAAHPALSSSDVPAFVPWMSQEAQGALTHDERSQQQQ